MADSLKDIRSKIDALDTRLVQLLSARAQLAKQAWQANDFKWQVRFELAVPEARPWREYTDEAGLPDWYADMLSYPGTRPETWYVADGPILPDA